MRKRTLKLLLILAFSVIPLILAEQSFPAEKVPGVTDTTIRIGSAGSFSGPFFLIGYPQTHGLEMIYNKANDEGGIHGRKIVFVAEDDGGIPAKALAAAKKLCTQDDVFLIHGFAGSNPALAAKPEIERSGVPWLIMSATNDNLMKPFCRTIFTTALQASQEGRMMADFAMSMPGVKRVAVVSQQDAWGRMKYEPCLQQLKEKYGVTPVANEEVEPDISDATPQVLKIMGAKPDVVLLIVYDRASFVILRDAYVKGLKVPFVGNSMQMDLYDMLKKVGNYDAIKNVYGCSFSKYPLDHPKMENWVKLRKQYFPDDANIAFNYIACGGAQVIVEALKRAGRDLTREKWIEAMESTKNFQTDFYPEPISFSPADHIGNKAGSFCTFTKGKKVVHIGAKWVQVEKD
ncbi:MAG: hypothetical protein A2157_04440 [Deltaproteobacteria bacterium RBG_16_47_11]|nr:MAG: hypothetical protein A2157_04440 [Deltaproteobacteria bacterium RBG_16_47_11]